jgi:putative Ca2+/H+ antiporter (TMEM165/GDT1 family)
MAALVAAALIQVGDRPAWLAAILADRFRAPVTVVAMAALAIAAASALAVVGGMLVAPYLTPEAKAAFLALALVLQGGGALFPAKAPDRLDGWRIGAAATSLLGLFILAFGDGLQFVVVALAARAAVPWLAAVGATLGAVAVIAPAALLGERDWCRLPLAGVRRAIAVLFLIGGVVLALGGVGLI